VSQAIGYRMNPWLVVGLVAALVLLAAVLVVAAQQSGLIHMIGGTLQGPQRMAPNCPGSFSPC
jgi:hypothetical protein